MSGSQVRANITRVRALIGSHWPEVRIAAAEALARAGAEPDVLRRALSKERNDVVTATLCEALMLMDDQRSVTSLKNVARNHPSPLARRHAVWAVSELTGAASVPFLRSLQQRERSRRVQATITAALISSGQTDELQPLLRMLASRDYLIRISIANYLADNAPRTLDCAAILSRVRDALPGENSNAVRAALRKAIGVWRNNC